MIKKNTSRILLYVSLSVMLFLLAGLGWLVSVSSFGMLTTSVSPNLIPDPSYVSFARRYCDFLAAIARDAWLLVPLLAVVITAWLQWRRDRLFSFAIAVVGCNLLLVYHIVFVLMNASMKQ